MKIFKKKKVEDEQQRKAEQSYGESESIPVFKERGKSRVSDKGKTGNAPKHG